MPKEAIRERGGAIRHRTVKLKDGRYIRIAIVRKKGPHDGKTIAGPVHKVKG